MIPAENAWVFHTGDADGAGKKKTQGLGGFWTDVCSEFHWEQAISLGMKGKPLKMADILIVRRSPAAQTLVGGFNFSHTADQ